MCGLYYVVCASYMLSRLDDRSLAICLFFFQAEDGIRDLVRSRGLGDVYKRQVQGKLSNERFVSGAPEAVVDKEKAKLADGQERIKILVDDIKRLEGMI